ncbi:MAG: 4Fe-4S dicluster domain-containing protein [Bilophila sp.]
MSRYMIESVPEKCRACRRCEIACIAAHHGLTFKDALKKRDELVARVHVVKSGTIKSPVSCRQCENAPCARICPTGAMHVEDGHVLMNVQVCSGCQLCLMACAYGAISLESIGLPQAGTETMAQKSRTVAVRCDLCVDWMRQEGKSVPACVEACPVHARSMVQL